MEGPEGRVGSALSLLLHAADRLSRKVASVPFSCKCELPFLIRG